MMLSVYLLQEEWRVHMLPIQFFFLTCNPVIDMRLRCKSDGYDYPSGVPPQVTKVLDLDIVSLALYCTILHIQFPLSEGFCFADSVGASWARRCCQAI